MIKGVYTALVTPFRDGQIDEAALVNLVNDQVAAGVDGVVPVGSTGESPTLSPAEHLKVIEITVKTVAKRCKVLAGTGANSTSEALQFTQEAANLGADACLMVAPYYNKPSQEGIFQHFSTIASKVDIPIVLYSIPGRCGIEIAVPTIKRLAEAHKNIVAVKEAGGQSDRVSQICKAVTRPDFTVMCGDDALTLSFMAVGAVGVISVATNIVPKPVCEMVNAFAKGNFTEALSLHRKYYNLFKNLFVETNPVPIKEALAMVNKCTAEVRLPLVNLSEKSRQIVADTLKEVGIL